MSPVELIYESPEILPLFTSIRSAAQSAASSISTFTRFNPLLRPAIFTSNVAVPVVVTETIDGTMLIVCAIAPSPAVITSITTAHNTPILLIIFLLMIFSYPSKTSSWRTSAHEDQSLLLTGNYRPIKSFHCHYVEIHSVCQALARFISRVPSNFVAHNKPALVHQATT